MTGSLYHESSLAARQMKFNELLAKALDDAVVTGYETRKIVVQLSELVALQSVRLLELEEKVERLERGT